MTPSIILLHGKDLRVHDLPALIYAERTKLRVIPIYIYDDEGEKPWPLGGASKWWLHSSLLSLQKEYQKLGSNLGVFKGDTVSILKKLCNKYAVQEVALSERFTPNHFLLDKRLVKTFPKVSFHKGSYLIDPREVLNGSGSPYVVFTPFSKAAEKEIVIKAPLKPPKLYSFPKEISTSVKSLELLPKISWDEGLEKAWTPGGREAKKRLKRLCEKVLPSYEQTRDLFFEEASSKLSPHLAFGEISPNEVWHTLLGETHTHTFFKQLLWREFGNYFLYHHPKGHQTSFKGAFERFEWEGGRKTLLSWKKGETGYPIVDAAMRDLRKSGWMPNRARMIVGSFLTKDLLIHWKKGAIWFWDNLVDADLGNNTLGWQWVSGSGPDAAPYFRIFNPITQSKKFDPDGEYIRKHVPEIAHLPDKWIHTPWLAPKELSLNGYSKPIIDHDTQRKLALERFAKIR